MAQSAHLLVDRPEVTYIRLTWRAQTLAAILLVLARLFVDDDRIAADLKALGNSISLHGGKRDSL